MGTRELDRLAERDAAGRRYNEALTALDEALPRAVTVPAATPAPVPAAEALHERAAILGDGVPMPRGWRGRLAGFVWRLVGPLFQRQQEYNLALADHLAHAGHARRESARAAEDAYAAMRQHLEVGFEDVFRGSSEDIRARQRDYADGFAGATDVLDLGCGRGEFLELLRERGVSARGIEANPEMAAVCRTRGLDVAMATRSRTSTRLADESLGGVVALQVVEHLEPEYLVRLIETAHAKLRPGGRIVLETINAACWVAFFESYIRDITHVRPLHPETLKFLVVAAGFENVDVHYRSPSVGAPSGCHVRSTRVSMTARR
jgi:2-polyprenyl-3-methyl-5-hydroxy-6-metoxy-1,4-benzoquinol methylase